MLRARHETNSKERNEPKNVNPKCNLPPKMPNKAVMDRMLMDNKKDPSIRLSMRESFL